MLIVHRGHLEMVKPFLGSKFIDVSLNSNHGQTPIHFAISGPDHPATEMKILHELLSELRVDITVRDERGRSVSSCAAEVDATKAMEKWDEYILASSALWVFREIETNKCIV